MAPARREAENRPLEPRLRDERAAYAVEDALYNPLRPQNASPASSGMRMPMIEDNTFQHVVDQHVASRGNHPAVETMDRTFSYAELSELVHVAA